MCISSTDINIVWYADDMPSSAKWEACIEFISKLDEDELLRQAGNVLEAIYTEYIASYYGMGDYEVELRLYDILSELQNRIGYLQVDKQFIEMLDKQKHVLALYANKDYASLLHEGIIDDDNYELFVRMECETKSE